jgi:hypothetical protein
MRVITRQNLEAALAAIDDRLLQETESLDLRADRARILSELGQTEEAKRQYLEILKRDQTHFGTLVNFADLLARTGYTSAARIAYTAAITHHPANPKGHSHFGDLLASEKKLVEAREHYETALRFDPAHVAAHRGLAAIFWELGDAERAEHHLERQYQNQPLATFPYLGRSKPIPILVLMSASRGNLPWHDLIDNRVFLIITIATEFFDCAQPLPAHRLIFNAIGDADVCQPALEAAAALVARTTAPVINSPAAVLETGRMANSERLRDLPGVVTPRMARVPRTTLAGPDGAGHLARLGLTFPLLVRRPGFHTGEHFELVPTPETLTSAVAGLPSDEVLAIEYLDARGPDGKARKYRVMTIDGQLYPLHLAISEQWKVHYFSAEMSDNPAHRAEEAAFLNDMPGVLGPKALRALEQICDAQGLDYGGVDFALGKDGEVLLFEANATMLIKAPGPGAQWDYRRAPIDRALQAARRLIFAHTQARVPAHA